MKISKNRQDNTYSTVDGYHVFGSSITAYRKSSTGDGSYWVVTGGTALQLTEESTKAFIHDIGWYNNHE